MIFLISDIAVEICKLRGIVSVISSIPRRRVFRLQGYDYSSEGLYFVTICTDRRATLFGEILDGKMIMNEFGRIVDEIWRGMFPFVDDSDSSIVMPNHLHGIIAITNIAAGGSRTAPTRKSLGRSVGAFKTVSTRRINEIRGTPGVPLSGSGIFTNTSFGTKNRLRG